MTYLNWTKELFLRSSFESEKLSALNKAIISSVVIIVFASSFLDQMQVMIHIWLAVSASLLTFQLYKRVIFVKLQADMMTTSNFKINSVVIIFTHILSWISGPGLITAFINLLEISASIMLIKPYLPKYYFPSIAALTVVIFSVLALTKTVHFFVSLPIALLAAFVSFYGFKTALSVKYDLNDPDLESISMLTRNHTKIKGNIRLKEIFGTIFSLLITAVTGLVLAYWIILSINPFWMRAKNGASKYETLHRLPHDVNLRVREVSSLKDLEFFKRNIKSFPVVIKPSICTTNSRNVVRCDNYKCLKEYLSKRIEEGPLEDGENGEKGSWVIQEYASEIEGVVFYYKMPYMTRGAIKNVGIRQESVKSPAASDEDSTNKSLTARYWPEKFRQDFSPEFKAFFDDLASKIPGYNGGRFDIMLASDKLQDPRDISVLELNVFFLGCIEEKKIKSVWDELRRIRTSLMQFYIGIVNIVGGYNFLSFWGILVRVPELFSRAQMCGNHEHLFAKP